MRTSDLSVVLTGATGGIGSAIARELVAGGATVLLVARRDAPLVALARELAPPDDRRRRVDALAADCTTASGRVAVRDAAIARGVNALVNAAGLPCFGAVEQLEDDRIEAVIRTNLLAPIQLVRQLLPHLRRQPQARVLSVGSALGRLALPGFSVYSASKFGLRGFSEALRRELADTPVRVQYLGPRTTRTRFNDSRVEAYNRATATQSDAPERVAHAAVQMLRSGAAERFLGFPESPAGRVNGAFPRLLDGAFRKHRLSLPGRAASAA
jgi:short-subunit dehydrogenase